jgi:hypothetical protein
MKGGKAARAEACGLQSYGAAPAVRGLARAAILERRLIASLSGAAALHTALLLAVALSGARSLPAASREPVVSIDLITLREEPPPAAPEPEPRSEQPASSPAAPRPQPTARARRTPAAVLAAKGASEAAIVPEGGTTPGDDGASATAPGPAPDEGEGRAPINLGLDGSVGRWALQAEQEKQRSAAPKDVAGIQGGLLQQDTDHGRGPGFEIAARLIERGRELAPIGSSATAEFVIEPDGRISSAVLLESRSASEAWQRVLQDLQQSLPRVRRAPSRRIRAQLSLVSRGSPPAGGKSSGQGLTFDLSNIGAAQQHWFHVRVLAQILD